MIVDYKAVKKMFKKAGIDLLKLPDVDSDTDSCRRPTGPWSLDAPRNQPASASPQPSLCILSIDQYRSAPALQKPYNGDGRWQMIIGGREPRGFGHLKVNDYTPDAEQ